MDQIQGIMGYLNKFPDLVKLQRPIRRAWFVVWQPHQIHVTAVPFDEEYYSGTLEPGLRKWYFTKFLPAAAHKHNGDLIPGQASAAATIHISG